jgi:hypothetical protein
MRGRLGETGLVGGALENKESLREGGWERLGLRVRCLRGYVLG